MNTLLTHTPREPAKVMGYEYGIWGGYEKTGKEFK